MPSAGSNTAVALVLGKQIELEVHAVAQRSRVAGGQIEVVPRHTLHFDPGLVHCADEKPTGQLLERAVMHQPDRQCAVGVGDEVGVDAVQPGVASAHQQFFRNRQRRFHFKALDFRSAGVAHHQVETGGRSNAGLQAGSLFALVIHEESCRVQSHAPIRKRALEAYFVIPQFLGVEARVRGGRAGDCRHSAGLYALGDRAVGENIVRVLVFQRKPGRKEAVLGITLCGGSNVHGNRGKCHPHHAVAAHDPVRIGGFVGVARFYRSGQLVGEVVFQHPVHRPVIRIAPFVALGNRILRRYVRASGGCRRKEDQGNQIAVLLPHFLAPVKATHGPAQTVGFQIAQSQFQIRLVHFGFQVEYELRRKGLVDRYGRQEDRRPGHAVVVHVHVLSSFGGGASQPGVELGGAKIPFRPGVQKQRIEGASLVVLTGIGVEAGRYRFQ